MSQQHPRVLVCAYLSSSTPQVVRIARADFSAKVCSESVRHWNREKVLISQIDRWHRYYIDSIDIVDRYYRQIDILPGWGELTGGTTCSRPGSLSEDTGSSLSFQSFRDTGSFSIFTKYSTNHLDHGPQQTVSLENVLLVLGFQVLVLQGHHRVQSLDIALKKQLKSKIFTWLRDKNITFLFT